MRKEKSEERGGGVWNREERGSKGREMMEYELQVLEREERDFGGKREWSEWGSPLQKLERE